MIKGNRKSKLVYSTKRGGKLDRLTIENKEYPQDPIIGTVYRRVFGDGKLTILSGGAYRYTPSERYMRALSKYHAVPKRRININF